MLTAVQFHWNIEPVLSYASTIHILQSIESFFMYKRVKTNESKVSFLLFIRLKTLESEPHTIEESERAAGLGSYVAPTRKRKIVSQNEADNMDESDDVEVKKVKKKWILCDLLFLVYNSLLCDLTMH